MDRLALEMAEERFRRATNAVAKLKSAKGFSEAEEAWCDFLMAASGIFSKLEQGAKGKGKSTAWFGRTKKKRKECGVLRYLHYARNSEEHGIERITERVPGNATGFDNTPLRFGERVQVIISEYDPNLRIEIGEKSPGIMSGPHISLVRVHDRRFNDFCDPPELLETNGIRCLHADLAAEAAIPIIRDIIDEARHLTEDTSGAIVS